MPSLYIAIYRPRTGNYYHWAPCLRDGGKSTIFQVNGTHPNFIRNSRGAEPSESTSHKKNVFIASIRDTDVETVRDVYFDTEVDNENPGWTCQDFFLDVLDKLCEDDVIDDQDEDYRSGRQEALDCYGPQ